MEKIIRVKGIGEVTLEKSFRFIMNYNEKNQNNLQLFE